MTIANNHSDATALDCFAEIVYKPLREKGEDAFAYRFDRSDVQTQAVFDGCGGAGSWQYAEFKNATGAFVAAQSIAKAYDGWFRSLPADFFRSADRTGESFQNMAQSVLQDLKRSCAPMRVSGSMVKSFPCTASAAILVPGEDALSLITLNIGDSRVYFLTPQTGLVQITTDDSLGNPDPLESLQDSAPLSDMLNADYPFCVHRQRLRLHYPCAVLTATDGVFGYFRSPMDFEHVLLDAAMRAKSFAQYEAMCKKQIVDATGDDSTAILSFYGWGSFENFRRKLTKRYQQVSALVQSLDEAQETGTLESVLDEAWQRYRKQTLFDEMQG